MGAVGVKIGDSTQFAKTVSESDVYLFAGITGDFADNHVNEQTMAGTTYGKRIAHGALLVGYMSTCSTMIARKAMAGGETGTPVSIGFDRVRFLEPVFFGDTVTINYVIAKVDEERSRAHASVEVTNQHGDKVAIAEHLLQWVE